VALVVTIIVLLILAGVTISMLFGENGIITQANSAKEANKKAQAEEQSVLSQIANQIQNVTDEGFESTKSVNRPQLTTGMTRIMFSNGQTILDGEEGWDEENWYNYEEKNWANVETEDGSMWVWIPRFAYKITYTDASNKSAGGTIDVVFLKGTTNLDANGNDVTSESYVDSKGVQGAYTVHPSFQNGSSTNYANGEWKEEITGFWMAKFQAGLSDDASASKTTSVSGMTNSYYPVFQGQKVAYNNINISQCFRLSQALTEDGNPYGITNADSHLTKNSEWGAVVYLSFSKYGKTGGTYDVNKEVYINNVTYTSYGQTATKKSIRNSGVCAITGYAGSTKNSSQNILYDTTILTDTVEGKNPNDVTEKSYAWYTENGTQASTTGTIYGVYDMSGALEEYTSGYMKQEKLYGQLKNYGKEFIFNKAEDGEVDYSSFVGNTPYVTEYPAYESGGLKAELEEIGRYGDAYLETWGWFGDWENNDASGSFTVRGASWSSTSIAGVFAFDDYTGVNSNNKRFPFSANCRVEKEKICKLLSKIFNLN
jgi:hypothetical protein